MSAQVILGDCLEVMKTLESGSIDMILCDLPYGTTACSWDAVIPFEPLWAEYRRLIRPGGAIVLTAQQPFTSALVLSNPGAYRHQWVWNKNNSAGFATVKHRPFAVCEDVLVFSFEGRATYYPQLEQRGKPRNKGGYSTSEAYGIDPSKSQAHNDIYYPKNLLTFSNADQTGKVHPTQKPVELFEYLIRTYTLPGQIVLDNCAGSGTTGVAAIQCNRQAILIEKDPRYHAIASRRIANAQPALLGVM